MMVFIKFIKNVLWKPLEKFLLAIFNFSEKNFYMCIIHVILSISNERSCRKNLIKLKITNKNVKNEEKEKLCKIPQMFV